MKHFFENLVKAQLKFTKIFQSDNSYNKTQNFYGPNYFIGKQSKEITKKIGSSFPHLMQKKNKS